MKISNNNSGSETLFIQLQDRDFLEKQRVAGKCVSSIMIQLEQMVKDRTQLSMKQIDMWVDDEIVKQGCSATFKNYKGFPAACCISVDSKDRHVLVHGIPDDYVLRSGDVVKFDFGATFMGSVADSAITCVFGEPRKQEHLHLIETTKQSLYEAIRKVKVGERLGVVGDTVYKRIKGAGYSAITKLGGHGISKTSEGDGVAHAHPFISNRADKNSGVRFQEGFVGAIEPMGKFGDDKTRIDKDGWSVIVDDYSSHWEHTIYIHKDKVEVITQRENETIFS